MDDDPHTTQSDLLKEFCELNVKNSESGSIGSGSIGSGSIGSGSIGSGSIGSGSIEEMDGLDWKDYSLMNNEYFQLLISLWKQPIDHHSHHQQQQPPLHTKEQQPHHSIMLMMKFSSLHSSSHSSIVEKFMCIRKDEQIISSQLNHLKLNYNSDTIRAICLFKKFVNISILNGLLILFHSINISNIIGEE
ncbi:hypothetical protein FDP41_003500 [Naegleria fowleri]|uniref:Uncharacterized protein n=1 Tax=Naegleria fowleri TaxID=5763 RepID=A0A6A5BUA1_NAEFO|nr:uncharacterized protein FDP41_003500 [Naegleria fowleri]KAF0977508.1 hypothetical protein FDP41_003500 [Naegleria fowleri]